MTFARLDSETILFELGSTRTRGYLFKTRLERTRARHWLARLDSGWLELARTRSVQIFTFTMRLALIVRYRAINEPFSGPKDIKKLCSVQYVQIE
jgi:hypothetical protein